MLEETMFINATGARVIRRAQAKAEVFSGNSEMKGATHWMKTNCEIPRLTATDIMEFKKGSATTKMIAPPTRKRPATAAHRRPPWKDNAQRETAGISSSSSSISGRGGSRSRITRYTTYVVVKKAASRSDRFPFPQTTTK